MNDRSLRIATLVYGVGLALHSADHLRRGRDVLTPEVASVGAITTIVGALAVVLVLTRHPRAPVIAVTTGFPIALLVVAGHLVPSSGAFSDPFPGAAGTGVTSFSWITAILEVVGALAMALAGANLLSHERRRIR
jgi:hypothetical protein